MVKVPKISMDYFFLSEVDKKANKNPMLVMIEENTKDRYARAVGQKGIGDNGNIYWLIKDMSAESKTWGHAGGQAGHIIAKSDGERAIVAVREALAKFHGGTVVPEAPAKGESPSNGAIEEAGKTVREFVRVYRDQIQENAKITILSDSVLLQWMIRWAAMAGSRFKVGADGRTAFERRREENIQLQWSRLENTCGTDS